MSQSLQFLAEILWCESATLPDGTVHLAEATVEGWFRSAEGQTTAAAFYLDPDERRDLDVLLARAAERFIVGAGRSGSHDA